MKRYTLTLLAPALLFSAQSVRADGLEVALGSTQESVKGRKSIRVKTLALSGDVSEKVRLESEFPIGVSPRGLTMRPLLGAIWTFQETDRFSLAFHPQYDFGDPAFAARRRLSGGGQSLTLPLEAEVGDEKRLRLTGTLGATIPRRGGTMGLYSLGARHLWSRATTLGTELENSGGQTLLHLINEWKLDRKSNITLDYAKNIQRIRSGDTTSVFRAEIALKF